MKDINNILAKYFSGEATPQEVVLAEQWKETNPEEFESLSTAWKNITPELNENAHLSELKEFNHIKAWQKVDAKLYNEKETKVIKLNFYRRVAAACAILLVGLTGLWYFNSGNDFIEIANNTSSSKEIQLSDGSKIWLASNSTLEYAANFSEKRDLKLEGEAFFEVARDENHPFIIETTYGSVEVLGTAFNVNTNNSETTVSVEHGKVALRNGSDEVKLTAGQSAHANENSMSSITTSDENFDAWRTGIFRFDNTPLSEVISLLNSHYETEIVLSSSNQENNHINGTFENVPLDDIIQVITLTCKLKSEYTGNTIILK